MAGPFEEPQGPGGGEEPTQYPGDASGFVHPALVQSVVNQQTDEGQDWAAQAANKVQDYLTGKAIATAAQQAGDETVANLGRTKDNLVGMVQSDPGSIPLALDLAQHSVKGVVDQHQNLDDDTRSTLAQQLTDSMQQEIAHTGVQKIAEIDKGAALKAIGQYGDYLPQDQQDMLKQYADVQEGFRAQDTAAAGVQAAKDAAARGYQAASNYLTGLVDPATHEFRSPPGFVSTMMADPSLALPTKLALNAGYTMLNRNGDVPQSNPSVVADMINRIASSDKPQQGELISHLGSGLTVADTAWLNHLLGPSSPQRQADLRALAETVNSARDTLAAPENGAAGHQAFGRFTNWLLPALRNGANLGELTENNAVQRFAPTVKDYAAATPRTGINDGLLNLARRNMGGQ
jgi:hypothetical protein